MSNNLFVYFVDMPTRLEHLPNELFVSIFIYFDIRNLYNSFWGINQRINNLLRSLNNLSFIINKNDSLFIEIFASQIVRLKINTSQAIDFNQFSNLHSLELCQASDIQIEQIRSDIMPNLINLIISTPFHISFPFKLIQELFSNNFRFLYHAKLSRINTFQTPLKFQSLSLHSLQITCNDLNVISQILLACPNLFSFHVTFFGENHHILPLSSYYDHPLEEFFLHAPYHKLSFDTIQILFLSIPNVKYLLLDCLCREPFIHLIESILNRLKQLNRFECEILESTNHNMVDIEIIQQMNECFEDLQCIEKDNGYRLYLA